MAKTAIFRSRDLVKQILTYSHSRQRLQQVAAVKPAAIIEETLNLLMATLPSTINVQLIKGTGAVEATIHADASRIQEALLNLCNNAVQAMEETGKLTLFLDCVTLTAEDIPAEYDGLLAGTYARISIQDTGCGIEKEILNKIFDPFFTTKEVGVGTGMGLSTVQGIVEQHQGWLKVYSTPAEGSQFELYFPVVEPEIPAAVSEPEALLHGTETILLVDDNGMLADIWGQMLTKLGYNVRVMTNSVEALKLFSADPDHFDLVITDQTMPDLTGVALIAQLRQLRPDLPTILYTGHSAQISEEQALQQGINAYLMKPLDLAGLARTIRKVLRAEK
jgi:CheY-like chemotaxis protein